MLSIKAITEVSKSRTERVPFERALDFIKEGQMGDKNSGRIATVNTFCSKRKETFIATIEFYFQL